MASIEGRMESSSMSAKISLKGIDDVEGAQNSDEMSHIRRSRM